MFLGMQQRISQDCGCWWCAVPRVVAAAAAAAAAARSVIGSAAANGWRYTVNTREVGGGGMWVPGGCRAIAYGFFSDA